MTRPLLAAGISFLALLAAVVGVASQFGALGALSPHLPSALVAVALLFAPYWFLGFPLHTPLRRVLTRRSTRVAAMAAFVLPYLLFVVPRHSFRPDVFSALLATLLTIGALREYRKSTWLVLILLAAGVELPLFRNAFPVPGMTGLSKLIFVDAGLFAFLVVRPLDGIGFVWNISFRDILVGLREFLFFTPLALAIGFVLHFLHWHPGTPGLSHLAAGWVFTLLFIAVPEEIFFRGLLLNLLERRWGTKRAVFNWRYVILAAIAGIFYGRAWLDRRRVITSGITHATVDTVWSIWLR